MSIDDRAAAAAVAALLADGGSLVSVAACTAEEIDQAMARGRAWRLGEGVAVVLRPEPGSPMVISGLEIAVITYANLMRAHARTVQPKKKRGRKKQAEDQS